MGNQNQMIAYMMQNQQPALGAPPLDPSVQPAQMGAQSSGISPSSGLMGLDPSTLAKLYKSGTFGANAMSGGYGAGGNGLTQMAPYSQGIGPQDAAKISAMFAGG